MNTSEMLALAERHVAAGNYEEADRLCREAIELDPENARPWHLLGKVAECLGLRDVAADLFGHAEKLSPRTPAPPAQVPAAGTSADLAGSDDAFVIDRYLSTLATQPANTRARANLARFLLRLGRFDEAATHAFAGLAHDPDDPELTVLAFQLVPATCATRDLPCSLKSAAGDLKLPRHPKLHRFMEQAANPPNAGGGRGGFERFAKYAGKLELDVFDIACLGIFWRRAAVRHGFDGAPTDARPMAYGHFAQVMSSKALGNHEKELFLKCLGYDTKSARAWNRLLFEEYVVPAIAAACERGDYSLVIYLDQANFYFGFAQQPYTEAQWDYCSSRIRPHLERAAARLAEKYQVAVEWPAAPRPRIGFTTQWAFKGISADNLVERTIEGIMAMEPRPFDAALYVTQGNYEAKHVDAARARGISVTVVDDPGGDGEPFIRTMLALRERLQGDGVSALVLAGVTESTATIAGALRLAPAQIFFSVGFRQVRLPAYWHGYFAGFSLYKHAELHNERLWRMGPAYVPSPYPAEGTAAMRQLADEVARLRQARFGGKLILAAIGRPIKIQNPAYMDALEKILQRNPGVAFLWTSPPDEAAVAQEMIDRRGISGQCVRMDWMDPRILGQLIDIHLDPFPFPNGHSMLETMYAGKAFVWLDNETTRDGHCSCGVVMPVLEGKVGTADEQAALKAIFADPATGENLAPAARTADEYVGYAQRLIDDADYRSAVGDAGRKFVTAFYADKTKSVRAFAEHCREIIAEAQAHDAVNERP